jgi:lysophospholipase L1-like esterase
LGYGSQQFYDAWDAAARALVTSARARGLQVVWAVAPPPAPSPTADPPVEDWFSLPMRHQVTTTLVAHARAYGNQFGIATTDWSQALSDTSGQWQPQLSYDGGVHAVRLDDGVHLTEDGSLRTSAWTTATLMQLWSRPQVESVV